MFDGLKNLLKLDLDNNQLISISKQTFSSTPSLSYLVTDERRWCCLAQHVETCLPAGDEFSSCEDLMSNIILRVSIWILGIISLVGNSFVIFWRSFNPSRNKMHSFLIVNLGMGDLLMGVYLLIVAAVDLHYRGVYAAHEVAWRSSSLCQAAGFISTFSSELSVFTLTVITCDRLITIKNPIGVHRSSSFIRKVMACVWVLVILLAAIPLSDLDYFQNFYGRSGVCLALHITNDKPNGWEYAVFIFLVLNLVNFGVMAISYAMMYLTAVKTKAAVRAGRRSDDVMARRMTLIVATDAACWLPIIFLGILSLCGVTIPPKVFSWVAVFILPLNAAVNPLLYTIWSESVWKSLNPLRQRFSSRRGSHQGRSTSAGRRESRWTSFKTWLGSDVTDIPHLTETEVRMVKTKPSVRVYNPVCQKLSEETEVVDHSNGNRVSDPVLQRTVSNGNESGQTTEGGQRVIVVDKSSRFSEGKKRTSHGADSTPFELVPLQKPTNYILNSKQNEEETQMKET